LEPGSSARQNLHCPRQRRGIDVSAHDHPVTTMVFLRLTSQEDDLSKLTRYEISLERVSARSKRWSDDKHRAER
jgi:hypothetical protein